MTDIGSKKKPEVDESAEPAVADVPAPEPWTAQRVFEWNAYYDIYVAAFVILLVFFISANKIQAINSGIWSLLQAGRQIATTGSPVVTDSTSIAGESLRWVNIPWLYEVSHYGLFEAVASLAPRPEAGLPVNKVSNPRDQYGAGALVALDALVRGLTALLLLGLRRKGPGLWWTALCVTAALGVTLGPEPVASFTPKEGGDVVRQLSASVGVQIGGIATPASVVSPETWGLMFLAIELLLLHQAINLGKTGRLYGLIPLFLVWANTDDSFSVGLIALAASTIGLFVDAQRDRLRPSSRSALIVLAICFGATFVNPSHAFGVMAAFGVMFKMIGLNIGPPTVQPHFLFGPNIVPAGYDEFARALRLYYVALVGLGLGSFLLNRRNFVLGRFLMFVAASVLWALAFNYFTAAFAVILAASLALNGQEWYQRTFGTEGKLGAGWTIWSTGGRLVTIALIFAAIARGVTGWGGQVGDAQFGFGFNPDDFPFESAEALKDAPIEGNILNTSLPQGDAIAWKALSKHKSFVDSRAHLYPQSVFDEWRVFRNDLKNDDIEKWQPFLDRYKISTVMIQLSGDRDIAPRTYVKLMNSPNWVPFYDDGAVVMFGRADSKAPAADVAYFKANRLDAADLVYQKTKPVPAWVRPPTATWDLVDSIFQNRLLNRPQPHVEAALRWLGPSSSTPGLPDPAHCVMAIREARTALSIKPDDSTAFQILIEAYELLLFQESAMVQGASPTPENYQRFLQAPQPSRFLANRTRQLLSAFNFRLDTLPPAKNVDDQALRANLNHQLAQFYLAVNALDLARNRLKLVAEEAQTSEMNDQFLRNLTKQLQELNQRVDQIKGQMDELAISQRASPLEKARFARANGAPDLAIRELEEANDAGVNQPGVRSTLVDLYCETGQLDKAFNLIANLNVDDPSLSTGIGTAPFRQAIVYLLLGNYDNAIFLIRDRSIAQVRTQRTLQAPMATQMFLSGDPITSTRTFLELPEKVGLQAEWEFELALMILEAGLPPEMAAEHFQTSLKLEPNLAVRPVIAYYLEKLGKPIPPLKTTTPKPAEPSTAPTLPLPSIPTGEKSDLPPSPFTTEPAKPVEPPKLLEIPKVLEPPPRLPDPPKP